MPEYSIPSLVMTGSPVRLTFVIPASWFNIHCIPSTESAVRQSPGVKHAVQIRLYETPQQVDPGVNVVAVR